MHYDQRSIWDWELRSVRVEPKQDEEHYQYEKCKKRKRRTYSQWCPFCSEPAIIGLIMGMLAAGIIFAVFLTLYLYKLNSKMTCPTMEPTSTTTTSSSTTTTTLTTTTTVTTITTSTTVTTTAALNMNLLINGDGETGPCALNNSIVSPTGWSFSGPITQLSYYNPQVVHQNSTTPGPSDRGQCYFIGGISATTSMWQTIDLTNKVNPSLIDNQTIRYNLSAWMGGYYNQNDHALVTLTFIDNNNQLAGNITSIGPVLSNDRGNVTSLIYQQTDGLVPVGTRSMLVCVTLNRGAGTVNNGDIDNIALSLY